MARINLDVRLNTPHKDIQRLKTELQTVANVVQNIKADPQLTAQLEAIDRLYKTIAAKAPKTVRSLNDVKNAEQRLRSEITKVNNEKQKGIRLDNQAATATKKKKSAETEEVKVKKQQTAQEEKHTASVKQNTNTVKTATDENKKHGDTVLSLAGKFVKWQAAATLVMTVINSIKFAIQDTNRVLVETEKRVVALQRVLPDGSASGGEMATRLYRLAQEYGQTFDAVSEIAQNFAKAGYNWEDTLKMTEAAILGINVAELDASEASEGMIAIMQQFKLDASELLSVVDKIDKVGDRFPVTSQKIYAALQRMGSTAANSNLTLEKSIGIITALSQSTGRGGENIGTALNSLINYTKKEKALEAFSSLSENVAKTVEEFKLGTKDILDVWKAVSVVIKNADARQTEILSNLTSDEEVKELSDSLKEELGDIYETEAKIYGQAGVFRRNYLIAALGNMETYEAATKEALEAEGYAVKENEKYLDTYEAKLNTLKSKWEEVANDEQGLLAVKKELVETATAALDLMQAVGGVRTAFLALGTAVATKYGGIWGFAVGAVLTIISAIAGGIEHAREEALLLANETYAKTKENVGILETLRDEYLAIADSEDTESEKNRKLYEWKKKLVEQYGFEKDALEDVNAERKTGLELLDKETANRYAKWLNDNEKAIKTAKENLEKARQGLNFEVKKNDSYKGLYADLEKLTGLSFGEIITEGEHASDRDYQIFANIEDVAQAYEKVSDAVEKLTYKKEAYINGISSEEQKQLNALISLQKKLEKSYTDDYALVQKATDARAYMLVFENRAAIASAKTAKEFENERKKIIDLASGDEKLAAAIEELINSQFPDLATESAILNGTLFDTNGQLKDLYKNALLASKGLLEAAIKAQEADLVLNEAQNEFDHSLLVRRKAEIEARLAQLNELLEIQKNSDTTTTTTTTTTEDAQKKEIERLKSIVSLRQAELTLMQKQGASDEEQIAKIGEIQAAMHDEAEYLRKIGGYDEEVLKLQAEWYDWEDKKAKIVEERQKAELDRLKSVVSLRNAELSLMEKQDADAEARIAKLSEIQDALHEQADYMRKIGADKEEELKLQTEWLSKEEQKNKILDEEKKKYREILQELQEEQTAEIQTQIDELKAARDVEQDQLDIEEKKEAVLKAQLALLQAMEETNVRVYNEQTGQWEWTSNGKNVQSARESLQNAQDAYDKALADRRYEERLSSLERQKEAAQNRFDRVINGEATDAEIVEMMRQNSAKAGSAAFDTETLHKENLALAGVVGAKYDAASGAYYKDGKRLYDNGGLLLGTGGIKATSRPEAVLDPTLTERLMNPSPTARFNDVVKGLGLLLGNGRDLAQNPPTVRSNTTTDNRNMSDNRAYYLNGVQIPRGADNMSIGELFRIMPLVGGN